MGETVEKEDKIVKIDAEKNGRGHYDQRVRITKAIIRAEFLRLLSLKSVSAITVRELCAGAQINRGTFYRYYTDVYDLKEQIENELLAEFAERVTRTLASTADPSSGKQVYGTVYTIFSLLKENSDLCRILLSGGDGQVVEKFAAAGQAIYTEYYTRLFAGVPADKLETYYLFVSAGCIAILRKWILSGMTEPLERLSEAVSEMITSGTGYLGRK